MTRLFAFFYGLSAYLAFLAVFAALAAFTAGVTWPRSIDGGSSAFPAPIALAIDAGLILAFGLQHSIMARRGFKEWIVRLVGKPLERSTYVLASVAAMLAILVFWQPVPLTVWSIESPTIAGILRGIGLAGYALVVIASFMIDHLDLFGVRQVTLHLLDQPYVDRPFATPGLYAHVRHPLYVGWLIALWVTPTMSLGHLVFAALFTSYILVAMAFEERDLVDHFGHTYRRYQHEVPALVPALRRTPAVVPQPVQDPAPIIRPILSRERLLATAGELIEARS